MRHPAGNVKVTFRLVLSRTGCYLKSVTAMQIFSAGFNAGDDFAEVIAVCERHGDYCLIGGNAVNAYSYTIFTADLDLVIAAGKLDAVAADLTALGFERWDAKYSVNFRKPGSQLVIQFSTDEMYQKYYPTAVVKKVLGLPVKVAAVENIIAGKVAAWSDPQRNAAKRYKDAADLVRLLETYPNLKNLFPAQIVADVFK